MHFRGPWLLYAVWLFVRPIYCVFYVWKKSLSSRRQQFAACSGYTTEEAGGVDTLAINLPPNACIALRFVQLSLSDRRHFPILIHYFYVQNEECDDLLIYDSASNKLPYIMAALHNSVFHVLGVIQPSALRLNVVEVHDGRNAVNSPVAASAIFAPIYSNYNVFCSSNPFWRNVKKRTSSLRRSVRGSNRKGRQPITFSCVGP